MVNTIRIIIIIIAFIIIEFITRGIAIDKIIAKQTRYIEKTKDKNAKAYRSYCINKYLSNYLTFKPYRIYIKHHNQGIIKALINMHKHRISSPERQGIIVINCITYYKDHHKKTYQQRFRDLCIENI